MTKYATIGGILSIVSGALGLIFALVLILFIVFFSYLFNGTVSGFDSTSDDALLFLVIFYGLVGLFFALISVLGIVGGIFAIKKQHWGWALAAAIAGSITFFPCGVAAIVLICLGKPEFVHPQANTVYLAPEAQL